MDQSEAVKDFLRKIKLKYREKRLNDEEQLFPLKKLVRLELVEGEQRQGYAAGQTRGRDNHAIKRTPLTAYSDILKAKDGDSVRKVLVEGDAGIGKTTLCTALSKDWANGELFQEFNMLLLLYLRQKKIASARSLLGLLKALHPSSEVCESIAKYIQGQEYKVLIIADGWDELSKEDSSKKLFLYEFLFGETYCVSVIVTSRPYASVSLRRLPCIDRLIEVCGFSKDNIKKFIDCKFVKEADKGSGLLEQLEGNPLVKSICSVPLNCASVCHLWDCLGGVLPTTMTGFYTKIILNIIWRNMRKKEEYEDFHSLSHFDALPEPLKQPWSNLCELAFQTLSEDKIVFSYEDLSRKFQNLTTDSAEVRYFGLLQSAEPILVDGHGVSFHFLHLTFQEYLAALHIVRQPTDKQLQLCQLYAGSKRFRMVWRFFFGIKFVIYKQAVDLRALTALLNKYKSRYNYVLLFCHFALEANQRNVNTLITSKIIEDACYNVWFQAHTAFDFAAVIHVLANLQDCSDINIGLSNCGLGDEQIAALMSALAGEHRMLHVKKLALSACSNKLSDQSLADLFDGASPAFNQSLWYVNLHNNKSIGPKTINSLTRVLAESLLVASKACGYGDDDDDDDDYYYGYTCTYLVLDNCSLGVGGISALADALCADRLAYLHQLSLDRSLTDDANTNAKLILALGSGHCSRLKLLNLSRNNLGVPGGNALGEILPCLHSGLSLILEETMLGDEGISALVQNLNDAVLSELTLSSNDIQVAGISRLAESVCTGSIKLYDYTFHLGNNPLGLGGVISVVKILTSDQPYSIHLSGCQLTTAGGIATNPYFLNAVDVQRFICSQQLQTTRSVYEFMVGNNNFSGEGIHILAAFMYACPCMKHLFCSSCGITSNDLEQLFILLSELKLKLPYLNVWGLDHNDIDDRGVSALIQRLSMFPKLTYIRLVGNTRVSPGMLKTLEENLDTGKNSSGSDSEGDLTSDSDMTEREDHGEDSSSHTEDSDTEEQYRAAKETRITTVTLKDMGNRPGLNSNEALSSSKRVRTVEDEGVEQLQLNLVEATTIGAGSESSQQEVVHLSTSSTSTQVQRLDLVLASDGEVSKHLGQIADDMCEWEGPISEQLGLTEEQYRAAKETGINLKDMGNRTRLSSIEEPPSSKRVRTTEDEGVEQLQSAVLHSASAEATTMGEGNLEKNSSGSDMIESEDHGEDSSSHTEDSDTEEQYRAAKETGITTVTLKDMGNRPGLSSSEEPSSSKRVRTMEDEEMEQLQLNLVEATTIGAGSESSQQEVVHPSTSSTSTQVQRLDLVLASEHGRVPKHLGQITDAMCEWEGPIAEQLGLTEEQYRAAKETGINLKDMGNRTRLSSIEEPPSSKRVRTTEDEGVEQLQSAVLHSASAEATTMEAECESGDQLKVVHLSASSSPATDSSRDCHSEKASLHMADSDEEVKLVSDFKLQSFEENSEFPYVSATTRWELENVHGVGLNGTGVVIAILDTGIDTKHDAFKDKLTQIKSRDFLSDNNSNPESHGTMAAFVAAGRGFIAKHIQKGGETKPLQKPIDIASGVAPSAKLVICRLETNIKCIIKALNWLIEEKKKEQNEWDVDVVSMSWGVVNDALNESAIQDRKKVREQIEELSRLKVIFIAAAGNYGDTKPELFPASLSNVISVGAFDPYNKPANFTPSYGTDVYAPGTKIVFPLVHKGIHDGMAVTQGTSCATPAIAGLVALKIQFERNKHEFLKGMKDNLHVKSILAGGENIHFDDMKKMFKRMRMDCDRPHVLLPYEYYRDRCHLNI